MNTSLEYLARNLAARMREIESNHVTKSFYRELEPDEQDEVPTGDTYNLLWDAILDEFKAAGFDIAMLLPPTWKRGQ